MMATLIIGKDSNEFALDLVKFLWKYKLLTKDEELQSVMIEKTDDGVSVDIEKFRRSKE